VRGWKSSILIVLVLGWTQLARAQLVPVPCTLVEGESAAIIAARFGVSIGDLAELNENTDLEALAPGTEIAVGYGERIEHRVARGETLLRIAHHYGVTATDIARWNALSDPRRMRADATLVIYAWPRIPPSSSIGGPSHGALQNGVRLRPARFWEIHDRDRAFVTRDAAIALERGFQSVLSHFADSPRIEIRDASVEHGGPLYGHHSHQSGRDIDIAYYRRSCRGTCVHHRVAPADLDAERQWRLLEPWLRADLVEYVFVDHALQEPLYQAARAAGATTAELARWFQYPGDAERHVGVIRHADGHRDHFHVRFACAAHDRECGPRRRGDEIPDAD
jgi:murein endopeptidase